MCPRGGLRASRAGEVEDTGKGGMTDAVWSLGEHGGRMGGRAPRSAGELVCGSTGQGPAWSRRVHRCGVFSFVPSVFPVTWGVRLSWGGGGLRRGVEACCEGRELEILPVESVGGSGRGSRLPGLSLRLAV